LVSSDLAPYAKNSDVSDISQELNNYALITYVNANFQLAGDYAYESWVNSNFLRKVEVYYLDSGQEGSEEGSTQTDPSSYIRNIIVDSALSRNSTNPVQNAVITLALDNKADKTDLNGYATKSELRNKADKTALGGFVEVDDLEYYLS
jgi:hypothetical protein